MIRCTRCNRLRDEKYLVIRKSKYTGKSRYRCRARSVCSSIARRNAGKDIKYPITQAEVEFFSELNGNDS